MLTRTASPAAFFLARSWLFDGTNVAVGTRVVGEICRECWAQWLKQQTMLINHYGLNVMDPQARTFLTKNMEAFLFKSGREEDVDTTKKGSIEW